MTEPKRKTPTGSVKKAVKKPVKKAVNKGYWDSRIPHPRAAAARTKAQEWTAGTFSEICDYMRGVEPDRPSVKARKVMMALVTHFKHSAPIAPTVPREAMTKVLNWGRQPPKMPLVLWRGVTRRALPARGSVITDACFTSFSFDEEVAWRFARHDTAYIIRLEASRISRGTPWAWFADPESVSSRERNIMKTLTDLPEDEVLLPPGYYKVLRVTGAKGVNPPVVDVAFIPQPDFVRRGAIPRIVNGEAVTKTIGGDRLAIRVDELVENTRIRRKT